MWSNPRALLRCRPHNQLPATSYPPPSAKEEHRTAPRHRNPTYNDAYKPGKLPEDRDESNSASKVHGAHVKSPGTSTCSQGKLEAPYTDPYTTFPLKTLDMNGINQTGPPREEPRPRLVFPAVHRPAASQTTSLSHTHISTKHLARDPAAPSSSHRSEAHAVKPTACPHRQQRPQICPRNPSTHPPSPPSRIRVIHTPTQHLSQLPNIHPPHQRFLPRLKTLPLPSSISQYHLASTPIHNLHSLHRTTHPPRLASTKGKRGYLLSPPLSSPPLQLLHAHTKRTKRLVS